jgi:purine nucleoside phosphorylase
MNKRHRDQEVEPTRLAIIGGSGLYSMSGLSDTREILLETPFGEPSAPIVIGTLENQRLAFLARHGLGHHLTPTEVNYRANIYALKSLGVERIISISACGSLREDYAPGHIVIPDQLFDNTRVGPGPSLEKGWLPTPVLPNRSAPTSQTASARPFRKPAQPSILVAYS